jgi:hypothetical protein
MKRRKTKRYQIEAGWQPDFADLIVEEHVVGDWVKWPDHEKIDYKLDKLIEQVAKPAGLGSCPPHMKGRCPYDYIRATRDMCVSCWIGWLEQLCAEEEEYV